MGKHILEIRHYSKIYSGNKKAVDDLSLTVNSGEIHAFIGHNGAGKTTTIRAVVGVMDFEQGQILIDGHSVKKEPVLCKSLTAYIPDNPDLYEHLKGNDYLNFIASVFDMSKEERKTKIEEYAQKLDIYKDLNTVISSYSHGMKQKLALVAGLIHSPKLMLLDEPFVGLDPISSHSFKEIMKQLASQGVTIFYSTHVLDVAEKICSHVAIIKQGKLIKYGTMQEVTSDDSLENIFLELENEKHN